MEIHLTGKKSIYEEIMETVERYIDLGVLKDGERLPSVRTLAMRLGVNPNTVARAYYELEDKNVIRSIPRRGCSPARRTSALPSRRRRVRASSCSAMPGSRARKRSPSSGKCTTDNIRTG